ncbi:MAG: Undecaprenyl-diphosphatase [Myxococcota bacterium]|nr:Undecaprenyl-diphosphatase [Myxococcota bacterium]
MTDAVVLGLVQGVTEFLPISSDGHLALAHSLFGFGEPSLAIDVMLHLGTWLATVIVFRGDVLDLIKGLPEFFRLMSQPVQWASSLREWSRAGVLLAIFLASLPTAVIGLLLKKPVEGIFQGAAPAAWFLLVTGALLLATKFSPSGDRPMTIGKALALGVAQGVAVLPGVSRSGSTICLALMMGLPRETSGRFSFLMSLPAVLGAVLVKARDGFGDAPPEPAAMLLGVAVSFVSGVAALTLLLEVIRRGRMFWFSAYVFPAALAALAMVYLT